MTDNLAAYKAQQRAGWKNFAPIEVHTTKPAAHLVHVAGVCPGQHALDVGCGTGVVAITARRAGATVTGLDLTPELLARAKENAGTAQLEDITWREGDAEDLPFGDASFDVVLSQWGHMFAPRPEIATQELLRVLRPGGTLAFTTWPPESGIGTMFGIVAKHLPLPAGVTPPVAWGDVATVRHLLGNAVRGLHFERGTLEYVALSPQHHRAEMEQTSAPVVKLVADFAKDRAKLAQFRGELDAAFAACFRDNVVRLDYLVTQATKV
ncbi:MAG: class I SAM-dependent methyltransferase [Halobacteriales archaeon]|nr:class I SAM-dependent methyltransferase [Halobacteriales archaeon]